MKLGIFFLITVTASFAAWAQKIPANQDNGRDLISQKSDASAKSHFESPYTFKKAYLGMTLVDFKRLTGGDLVDMPNGANLFGKMRVKKFPTPFCTDSMIHIQGVNDNPREGEVVCNPSPKEANQNLLEVADAKLEDVIYSFYDGKLYKISLTMLPRMYPQVVAAFSKKYGEPKGANTDSYQNDFGATWQGTNFIWKRGSQAILLNQGSGDSLGSSKGMIVDPTLGPPATSEKPLNF